MVSELCPFCDLVVAEADMIHHLAIRHGLHLDRHRDSSPGTRRMWLRLAPHRLFKRP